MSYVPECHILEQNTVCAQDVVSPGALLPLSSVHVPCPSVLKPRLVLREEVDDHVLYPLFFHRFHNLLFPRLDLWRGHVDVDITNYKQRDPSGMLSDGHNNVLYC